MSEMMLSDRFLFKAMVKWKSSLHLWVLLILSLETISKSSDEEQEQENKKRSKKNLELSESKKKLKPTSKSSQEDNGCLSTAVPFRASFIYTSCSRSTASPLIPRGVSACPDVQLFMWSSDKSSWPALHIPKVNRGGRHSPNTRLLRKELTAQIIKFHSQQVQGQFIFLILHCSIVYSSQSKMTLPVMMIIMWQVVFWGNMCVIIY